MVCRWPSCAVYCKADFSCIVYENIIYDTKTNFTASPFGMPSAFKCRDETTEDALGHVCSNTLAVHSQKIAARRAARTGMKISEIGAVTSLWRYPVSSLGGERKTSIKVGLGGIVGDRSHGVADVETGHVINPAQRQWQCAPQMLSRLGLGETPEVSCDGINWVPGDDPSGKAALEHAFGRPVHLRPYGARQDETHTTHRYKLSPVHLISLQALAALRKLLPDSHIDERRFRPNIVVDLPFGTDNPPPEYLLLGREFQIGALRLRGVQKAGRCSFTTLKGNPPRK